MVRKHIKRDYSSHRKSVLRPSDEYIKCEIFSYEHSETMMYSSYEDNVSTENAVKTNIVSWDCYKAETENRRLYIDCDYLVSDDAEYRIDVLYHPEKYFDLVQSFERGQEVDFDLLFGVYYKELPYSS